MSLHVGDVIVGPKQESYIDRFSLTGEMLYEGLWAAVRFEKESLFLVVDVHVPSSDVVMWHNKKVPDFQVELLALEVGYRFMFRGELTQLLATCDVMSRE